MEQQFHNPKLMQNYLPVFRGLSSDEKLDLAELLIEMVRRPEPPRSIDHLFGAWIGNDSAEEMIAAIENSRTSGPQRESF